MWGWGGVGGCGCGCGVWVCGCVGVSFVPGRILVQKSYAKRPGGGRGGACLVSCLGKTFISASWSSS